MPRFRYAGKRLDGVPCAGEVVAADRESVGPDLLTKGIFVDDVHPSLSVLQSFVIQRFYGSEVTRTTRQIGILLESRIDISDVFDLVGEQINHQPLRTVMMDIRESIEAGKSVADSFGDYPSIFDHSYRAMLEAGESSAQLDVAFDRIASYRERHEELIKSIRSALTYPVLVLVVAVLVVMALLTYVVPVFASMYENFGSELPALTQLIVRISDGIRDYAGIGFLVALVLAAVLFFVSRHASVRRFLNHLRLRIPGFKRVYRKNLSARFSRTLGALLTSGVDLTSSFDISTQVVNNGIVKERLRTALETVIGGGTLTDALEETRVFPKTLLRLCRSGEKSGQLGVMLTKAAEYYEKETANDLKLLTTLLEPIILLILGALIAFLLIAMYLPMFDLIGTL